jgi:uncharacterized repeat protein (TIGR01451 family)
VAVNSVTNKIYIGNFGSGNVTALTEQAVSAIPLTTTISPLAGGVSYSATPTFTLSAASAFAPTAPPVQGVFTQVDTWQGSWQAATPSAGVFTATTSTLALGTHVLYAYAIDGQDGTGCSNGDGTTCSPVVGSIAAYVFTVVPPVADVSLTLADSPDPAAGLGTLVYSISVANSGPSPASAVSIVQTLPAGVTFSSATGAGWSCGVGAGTVTCTRPALAVGAAPNVSVQVTTGPSATLLASSATVTIAEADPVLANNSDSETTTVNVATLLLTVARGGTGSGRVTSSPPGIDCGSDCSGSYDHNTVVNLTAIPAAGSVFAGWSGNCSGTANPFGITMNASRSCTATFVPATVVIGSRTKAVSGSYTINESIAYTITLTNTGTATQPDNSGHELADTLPSSLSLVSASATSGTVATDLPGNRVTWDGSIPSGGSATVTINATVKATAALGLTISNQALISYDANVDGTNESAELTDDPSLGGTSDPTDFVVVSPSMDFFTLAPCRLVDTRSPAGTYGGPALVAGAARAFPLFNRCGIPATARAVSVNLTVTQSTTAGNLRLYPASTPLPTVSSVNYVLGLTRANNSVVGLNGLGELGVYCEQASGTTHFILDVNGYFE